MDVVTCRSMNRTKRCGKCKKHLVASRFSRNASKPDGLQSRCKQCFKATHQKYYAKNKALHRVRDRRYKANVREKFFGFLAQRACVDCGNDDPLTLDFDHVRGEKADNVSKMITNGCSWKKLMSEIKKCVVRCANCHRKKTYANSFRAQWFRNKILGPKAHQ